MTVHASHPPYSHVTNPDMVHVHHVSEVAEWLDWTEGGGGKQADWWEGRCGGRCEGGQEGVQNGKRESMKLGRWEVRKSERYEGR